MIPLDDITIYPPAGVSFTGWYYTLFGLKGEDGVVYGIGPVLSGDQITAVAEEQGGIDFSSLPPDYVHDDLLNAAMRFNNRDNRIMEIFDEQTEADDFIARMKTLGGEEADTAARLTVEVWKEFRQNFQPNWKGYFNAEILRSAR